MKVTRHSVFETNSSSTHTISIVGGECKNPNRLYPSEDGTYRIFPGEFGWEVRTYHSAEVKASYVLTWAKQNKDARALEMLRDVIESEFIGAIVEFMPSDDKHHEWGYIDHQSAEEGNQVCEPAFESPETLRSFIFNPLSELHTDNDNRDNYDD